MDLEKRVANLENLFGALIKRIDNDKFYANADTQSERIGISTNTSGVAENGGCILDVADLSDENSSAIEDLAEIIDEINTRVDALEEKEA
jgi:hypothetical protein